MERGRVGLNERRQASKRTGDETRRYSSMLAARFVCASCPSRLFPQSQPALAPCALLRVPTGGRHRPNEPKAARPGRSHIGQANEPCHSGYTHPLPLEQEGRVSRASHDRSLPSTPLPSASVRAATGSPRDRHAEHGASQHRTETRRETPVRLAPLPLVLCSGLTLVPTGAVSVVLLPTVLGPCCSSADGVRSLTVLASSGQKLMSLTLLVVVLLSLWLTSLTVAACTCGNSPRVDIRRT